jgi:hypothetical protein
MINNAGNEHSAGHSREFDATGWEQVGLQDNTIEYIRRVAGDAWDLLRLDAALKKISAESDHPITLIGGGIRSGFNKSEGAKIAQLLFFASHVIYADIADITDPHPTNVMTANNFPDPEGLRTFLATTHASENEIPYLIAAGQENPLTIGLLQPAIGSGVQSLGIVTLAELTPTY